MKQAFFCIDKLAMVAETAILKQCMMLYLWELEELELIRGRQLGLEKINEQSITCLAFQR